MADEKQEAERLTAQGYRRTSNRYRMLSRIDRPDWLQVLAANLRRAPADFYVPGAAEPSGNWCSYYRRCLSRDTLEGVPEEVFKLVPSSDGDPCGYCPKEGEANG